MYINRVKYRLKILEKNYLPIRNRKDKINILFENFDEYYYKLEILNSVSPIILIYYKGENTISFNSIYFHIENFDELDKFIESYLKANTNKKILSEYVINQ